MPTKRGPKPGRRTPKLCHHKATGRAYVILNGRFVYCGRWGTAEANATYDVTIIRWLANGRRLEGEHAIVPDAAPPEPIHGPEGALVKHLVRDFLRHATDYYRRPDGGKSSSIANFKSACRPLRLLYGDLPAAEFSPGKLKAVRELMVTGGWTWRDRKKQIHTARPLTRKTVNDRVNRIRQMFNWGVEHELVRADVAMALRMVAGLREGRTDAKEGAGRTGVPLATVKQTLPAMNRHVRAMVQIQLATGMRPGELVTMRSGDIDRSAEPWTYRPRHHKNEHRGHDRDVFLGPEARELLTPFLKMDPDAYLFSPAEAEAERREAMTAARKTPAEYGNAPGTNRKRAPKWEPGDAYTVNSYRSAIERACDAAFPPPEDCGDVTPWRKAHRWTPHQLRHTAGDRLKRAHGWEAARVILGHRDVETTQIYTERDHALAKRIVEQAG